MTKQDILALFAPLAQGDGAKFFEHVADDVDWTVMGTHPLAGRYRSKADFLAGTFNKLALVLTQGTEPGVDHYCLLCRFAGSTIVEVRAYLDSWMVAEVFKENPIG